MYLRNIILGGDHILFFSFIKFYFFERFGDLHSFCFFGEPEYPSMDE